MKKNQILKILKNLMLLKILQIQLKMLLQEIKLPMQLNQELKKFMKCYLHHVSVKLHSVAKINLIVRLLTV